MLVVWYPIILAGICAGGAALAFVGARLYAARRESRLRRILKELAAGLGAEQKGDRFAVTYERVAFDIQLRPVAGISGALEVSTNLDNITREATEAPTGYRGNPSAKVLGRPTIRLLRKTWWSRLGERLGVVRGADTGDSAFDETFWIESSAPDADIRRVLSEPNARSALLDLVKAGADRVTINAKGVAFTVSFSVRTEETINVFTFLSAASGIASAAPFLPVFGAWAPERRRFPLVGLLWVLSLTALLTTPLVMATTLRTWSSSFRSVIPLVGLAVGLGVWTLLVPLLGRLLRRRSFARRHLFGIAFALLTSLPVHGAAAALRLDALVDHALIRRGYLGIDWPPIADSGWTWATLEPVPLLIPSPFTEGPVMIQSASIVRRAATAQTLELYIRFLNDADEPRWFVVPRRADLAGSSVGDTIRSLRAHELRGRGRVVVVELVLENGAGWHAFLVPAQASVSIERLVITSEYPSVPRLIPINAFRARALAVGDRPLEEWLGESPVSDDGAIVVDERQSGRVRALNVRAGHAGRPFIALGEEESGRDLLLQSPESHGH